MAAPIGPDDNVVSLKGVGEKQAAAFLRLGVRTVGELLRLYPRAYEDRRRLYTIRELIPGEPCRFVARSPRSRRLRG